MTARTGTIRELRRDLAAGKIRSVELAEHALARSNQNVGRNVYLWQDAAGTRAEAAREMAEPLLGLTARVGARRKVAQGD